MVAAGVGYGESFMPVYAVKVVFEDTLYVEADNEAQAKTRAADIVFDDEDRAFVAQPESAVEVDTTTQHVDLRHIY